MSTLSTLFLTNCCHIFEDVEYTKKGEKRTLCISVSYDFECSYDHIEVDADSDFAFLIKHMLSKFDLDELDNLCREYHAKRLTECK